MVISEPPPSSKKKNKKKKKKPLTEQNNAPPETENQKPPSQNIKNEPKKSALTINEVLPHQVGMKTVFKDVEVTMTHAGVVNEVVNSSSTSSKKKKKKKKAKSENTQETKDGESDPQNYIKFNEDRIELVNHPEISVTITNSANVPEKETPKPKDKGAVPPKPKDKSIESNKSKDKSAAPPKPKDKNAAPPKPKDKGAAPPKPKDQAAAPPKPKDKGSVPQQKEAQGSADNVSTTSKKKKKKKKKNANPDKLEETKVAEPDYTAPTYVKLPAAGDNCVLLVSHESFSANSKVSVTSTETVTVTSNSSSVLLKRKDSAGQPAFSPALKPEQCVSIFPVAQNSSIVEKNTGFDINSSLQKVSEMVNNESNVNESLVKDSSGNPQEPAQTKAQLKAERRAKQEAQRAAKLAKTAGKDVPVSTKAKVEEPKESTPKEDANGNEPAIDKSALKTPVVIEVCKKSHIFSHLPEWKDTSQNHLAVTSSKIHPAIIELGSHYGSGSLRGADSRCVGFLAAFREVVMDYKTPPNKELAKDLESKLSTYLKFLHGCRPLSVSVSNCVRFLRHQITHLSKDMSEEKAKEELFKSIGDFVKEEILLAKEAICIYASAKIVEGDTILVYAYSSVVKDVLCKAHDQKKSFHVIVSDARHNSEGEEMVRRLRQHGLQCSYVPSGSVSCIMKTVSKVIIGTHALLSNGSVISRAGCKEISQMASCYNVPVLVCCETYKFCERALTDSSVHNELGRPWELVEASVRESESLRKSETLSSLQMYNILYDVIPSDLLSVVITEKGLLPTTSVPVVLRLRHAGWQE